VGWKRKKPRPRRRRCCWEKDEHRGGNVKHWTDKIAAGTERKEGAYLVQGKKRLCRLSKFASVWYWRWSVRSTMYKSGGRKAFITVRGGPGPPRGLERGAKRKKQDGATAKREKVRRQADRKSRLTHGQGGRRLL